MSWIDRLRGKNEPASGHVARERLKVLVEYDRTRLAPGALDEIRREIVEVISRYVAVETDDVIVTLEQGTRIVAQVPIGDRTRNVTSSATAGAVEP
jgi:cell division topological specificity factor